MSTWFTELEDVAYSVVEYIPLVGTVYSLQRARVAYREENWARHWQSMANFLESSIRDVILVGEYAEFPEVALLHTMAESFTDKIIEIYHHEPKKPRIDITEELDEECGHVVVAESSKGKFKRQVFEGKAKGLHHFHGAVFTGTLTVPKYAPRGEKIRLDVPRGFYDGAPVTFSWKWTRDWDGKKNRPEATFGRIQLRAGTPTRFVLSSRKGANGWAGYDFWGKVNSEDQIAGVFCFDAEGIEGIDIDFRRVPGT